MTIEQYNNGNMWDKTILCLNLGPFLKETHGIVATNTSNFGRK
jgi:hypothetical protein